MRNSVSSFPGLVLNQGRPSSQSQHHLSLASSRRQLDLTEAHPLEWVHPCHKHLHQRTDRTVSTSELQRSRIIYRIIPLLTSLVVLVVSSVHQSFKRASTTTDSTKLPPPRPRDPMLISSHARVSPQTLTQLLTLHLPHQIRSTGLVHPVQHLQSPLRPRHCFKVILVSAEKALIAVRLSAKEKKHSVRNSTWPAAPRATLYLQ